MASVPSDSKVRSALADICNTLGVAIELFNVHVVAATATIILRVSHARVRRHAHRAPNMSISTSNLERIRDHIKDFFGIDTILSLEGSSDLDLCERGAATLIKEFLGDVEFDLILVPNVGINVEAKINTKSTLTAQLRETAEATLLRVLSDSGLRLSSVEFSIEAAAPPDLLVLRHLRPLAPATISEVTSSLSRESGYREVAARQVARSLDRLRKRKLIVFLNSRFVLTSAGLDALPSVRRRHGLDIQRALATGRRI